MSHSLLCLAANTKLTINYDIMRIKSTLNII